MSIAATPVENWPEHELKLLVPFGAGSNPDLVARLVAQEASKTLGKTIVVENKPGAGGNIATAQIAKANPDGYTFGLSINGPLVYNQFIVDNLGYDPEKDLAPLTLAATQPNILVSSKATGATTLKELVEKLKENPGKYNVATVGVGSGSHLTSELLLKETGTTATTVQYKGSPDAVTSLLAGDTQFATLAPGAVIALGKEGKLNVLAQASETRSSSLPDLPTVKETKVANIVSQAWNGFVISSKVDPAIQAKLHKALYDALKQPEIQEKFKAQYMEAIPSTQEEFKAFMKKEKEVWQPIIESLNLKKK
ncbi:ABC transporter substrate-binding protein [Pelistega indica]|uniref:ABC transporter substrate-binding protein n=2 Tax=Pelistega TaxID=106146 RepID=V8G9Q3_9BURK|nr:tripartite tricarboxylate transporter substrate binding protein [Pelistega indica]ETD73135.1 ABC transporter substrate-binding protein [Pelistega indica]